MERLRSAGELPDGPSGYSRGILNALPWEQSEVTDNVADRPVASASTRDAEQKVKPQKSLSTRLLAFSPTHLCL